MRRATQTQVLEKLASPDTVIVSLTITEGGYYVHQGTGEFDAETPDIQHDLAHPHQPNAAFVTSEALERRRDRGLVPFTIMSCDTAGMGDSKEDAARFRSSAVIRS